MKEKKVEVSICNSFFSKPPKNALKLKIQNPAIIRTAKKGFFYKCLRLRISATVSGVRNTKQMTSIIDYRFPSSTGQCVKLNFGEPCVAIVNSPYRNCFFVLGAGDRGASSCLFSSLCWVVSGNISPLFGQEGGGGICWKSAVAEEGTNVCSIASITTFVWGLGFRSPWTVYLVLSPLIMLASQILLQRWTMLKMELESLFNKHFFVFSNQSKWILQCLPLSESKIFLRRWQLSAWITRFIQSNVDQVWQLMATTVLVSSSSSDEACCDEASNRLFKMHRLLE